MATIQNYSGLTNQLSSLKDRASSIESQLMDSPTAYGGSAQPSFSDLSNQRELESIEAQMDRLNNDLIDKRWYGKESSGVNAPKEDVSKPGFFMKTLDYLSRPLYGIVGATKHYTGQGTGSLLDDIADNIQRNKNTFGDVLRSSGVPSGVAAPLGFALDIFGDPVNWATAGTAAFLPRVVMGGVKAAKSGENILKGMNIAAKSNILEKARTVSKITPFLRKSEAFSRLGKAAGSATAEWEKLSGITAEKLVQEAGLGVGSFRAGNVGEQVKELAKKVPGGEKFLQHWWYSPGDWIESARVKDILEQSLGEGVNKEEVLAAYKALKSGRPIAPELQAAFGRMKSRIESAGINLKKSENLIEPSVIEESSRVIDANGLTEIANRVSREVVKKVDDVATIINDPKLVTSMDPVENAMRLIHDNVNPNYTLEDVQKLISSGALQDTGIKWFDGMMKVIRDYTIKIDKDPEKAIQIGKQTMGFYEKALSLFRAGKVGSSPSAWVNAIVGNMVMWHMGMGSISGKFLNRLKLARNVLENKPGAALELEKMIKSSPFGGQMAAKLLQEEYRTAARGTFGTIDFLESSLHAEKIIDAAKKSGQIASNIKNDDILKSLYEAVDELGKSASNYQEKKVSDALRKAIERSSTVKAGTTAAREAVTAAGSATNRLDLGTGMLSNEMLNSGEVVSMLNKIKEKADAGNPAYKVLDIIMNRMPGGYEKIDQKFKLAGYIVSTFDGLTLNEIRNLRNVVNISSEEISLGKYVSKETGETLYRLSPKTALNLANTIFLNYNAMPAAVRVLRNFPILGSPFVSFMYGMALKTGQTMAYNPAAFNKVNYAMKEFGGQKSPLEKKALTGEYYKYLDNPWMMRVPYFFDKNPVYLNMKSMLPYYSLNMFNPTNTNYGSTTREKLVQAVQDSPILKDPVGATLFDYLIQPLILGEAIRPQGQFGQPLYPIDATGVERLGYGTRTLAEAFVPNMFSYAGIFTPEAVAPYVPSYRWRQLSMAMGGKTQLGKKSKEPAFSRAARTFLQASGIPVQAPVNYKYGGE